VTVAPAIWDGAGWRVGVCSLSRSLALWVVNRSGSSACKGAEVLSGSVVIGAERRGSWLLSWVMAVDRDGTARLKWPGLLLELLATVARSGRSRGALEMDGPGLLGLN
jgi:hypothetical protein